MFIHHLHIVEMARRAAATSHNRILEIAHLEEHIPLDFAERLLSALGKNLLYTAAKAVLDEDIEVDKLQIHFCRQSASESGLSTTHKSDEKNWSHNAVLNVFTKIHIFLHSAITRHDIPASMVGTTHAGMLFAAINTRILWGGGASRLRLCPKVLSSKQCGMERIAGAFRDAPRLLLRHGC